MLLKSQTVYHRRFRESPMALFGEGVVVALVFILVSFV
jgi:hypothetical protein